MTQPGAFPVSLRPANLQDLDALVAIDAQCFPPGIAYPREEIAFLLRTPSVLTLVADCNRSIAGFAAFSGLARCGSRRGELITIDVLPRFQRKGIGGLLHRELEERLRADGGTCIQLHVSVVNTTALRFYRRLGYRVLARVPDYYLNSMDAWRMEKLLT